jgi:hypothetical protein
MGQSSMKPVRQSWISAVVVHLDSLLTLVHFLYNLYIAGCMDFCCAVSLSMILVNNMPARDDPTGPEGSTRSSSASRCLKWLHCRVDDRRHPRIAQGKMRLPRGDPSSHQSRAHIVSGWNMLSRDRQGLIADRQIVTNMWGSCPTKGVEGRDARH